MTEKSACTDLQVLAEVDGVAAVEARPLTGRTHQVRVHMAHAGAPIAGDLLYGGPAASRLEDEVIRWPRVMLHAAGLALRWNRTHVVISSPVPEDFAALARFGLQHGTVSLSLPT